MGDVVFFSVVLSKYLFKRDAIAVCRQQQVLPPYSRTCGLAGETCRCDIEILLTRW